MGQTSKLQQVNSFNTDVIVSPNTILSMLYAHQRNRDIISMVVEFLSGKLLVIMYLL